MKKIVFIILGITIALIGVIYSFARRPGYTIGRQALDAIYSRSLDQVQQMSSFSLQRRAPTWLPKVSSYLQKTYGAVKDTKQVSRKIIDTTGPLGKVQESTWQVNAERGSYEMQTDVQTSSNKLYIITFRFPPSSKWIFATQWPSEFVR